MSDLVLYEEDIAALNAVLLNFIKDAQILCALLTNKEGQLLTCQGETAEIDTTSVAALVTGSFAATVSIANLIGEKEFKTMHHKGNQRHIHISLVDNDRYLATIFDNRTDLDRVGYYAGAYGDQLRQYLEAISGNAAGAYLPPMDLDSMASSPEELAFGDQLPGSADVDFAFSGLANFSDRYAEMPGDVPASKSEEPPAPQSTSAPDQDSQVPTGSDPGTAPHDQSRQPETAPHQETHFAPPNPSSTAYLRIKIKEAQAYRRRRVRDDLMGKIFGKK